MNTFEINVHRCPPVFGSSDPAAVEPRVVNDHDLMLAVRAGEIARLGELFERYQSPLFGFFVRMTNHRETSEDLVQLVFFRILKYRHTYRDEGKFSAWMYHLARKVAADHFRKNSRHAMPQATDPSDLHDHPDCTPPPGERAAVGDEVDLLRIALTRLPHDQREALTLHRFQQLKHEEIAQVLQCSVGAVKVRVHRALQSLRDHYFKLSKERTA